MHARLPGGYGREFCLLSSHLPFLLERGGDSVYSLMYPLANYYSYINYFCHLTFILTLQVINLPPLHHWVTLNFINTIYLPLPVRFILWYFFLLLITTISFQLKEVPLIFPVRPFMVMNFFSFSLPRKLFLLQFWMTTLPVRIFLLGRVFFFQHFEHIVLLTSRLQSFCWKICW